MAHHTPSLGLLLMCLISTVLINQLTQAQRGTGDRGSENGGCEVKPRCRLVEKAYAWSEDCTGTISICQGVCFAVCAQEAYSNANVDTGSIRNYGALTCTVTETRKTNITCTDGPREVWEAAACGCAPLDCMKEDGDFFHIPM